MANKISTYDVSEELVLQEALRALSIEKKGLTALEDAFSEALGKSFCKAVKKILSCRGRLIVSGMGKSGHIARKIAATFASTGTLAQFIHPAEASHGDLGMMSKDDLILLLSNSGETKELSDVIAYGKRNHMDIIGITQQEKSSLAKESTIQLVIPAVEEACPNRLAPTTSALMMLALGDALAMTLLKIKRFSPVDYKEFHPGGQLGKLLCRAHDLMHDHHLPLIKEDALMRDVLILMSRGRLGCAGVIGSHGKLIGIITDGDLRRHMSEELFLEKAATVMTKNPKTISKDILAIDALRLMNEHSITCLFVVNEAKEPIGAIHVHDILKAGIA